MKFCIEYVGGNHPHNMRLMGEDPRTEQLIEEMELCFCTYVQERDMDSYAITPAQIVDFISRYFGIVQPRVEAPQQSAKRPLTLAQRVARQANAQKATRVRMERLQHTNNIPIR